MDRLSTDLGTAATSDMGARLRRRWWVVALGLLVGLALGVAALSVQAKTYEATTSVLVTPTGTALDTSAVGSRTTDAINLDTEAQIVQSAAVADAARTLLKTQTSVSDLQQDVSVTVPPNSTVLDITYSAGTAQAAQQGSHAFAQAYLDNRASTAKAQVKNALDGLQGQLAAAQTQLKAITDRIASLAPNSPDRVFAESQQNTVVNQINDLTQRISPLQTAAATPGQIITDATAPTAPSSPLPALDLGAGLVVGLLLGLAAAFLLDQRDRRLRTPYDVSRLTGVATVGTVPADRVPVAVPGDTSAPVFDRLRNTVVGADAGRRAVQVADVSAAGASAGVALQLARSLARSSAATVLVIARPDSDLSRITGTSDLPGLVEVLRGSARLEDVLVRVPSLPDLSVVPVGREPRALEGLLQARALATALETLHADTPLVVETASPGLSAGAQAVAGHVDAVLLVAERGSTKAQAVTDAQEALQPVGGHLAGVLLAAPVRGRRREAGEVLQTSAQPVAPAQPLAAAPSAPAGAPEAAPPAQPAARTVYAGSSALDETVQ